MTYETLQKFRDGYEQGRFDTMVAVLEIIDRKIDNISFHPTLRFGFCSLRNEIEDLKGDEQDDAGFKTAMGQVIDIEVGTVLWEMRGTEQNGVIKWFAIPQCVDYIDDRKFLYAGGGGGGLGLIGHTVFLSREEALENFMKTHDSLEEELPNGGVLPDDVVSLPRTNWDDKKIYKYNGGVNDCGVYVGGLSQLKNITNQLSWLDYFDKEFAYREASLTLRQIYQQVRRIEGYANSIITVIQNDPMRAEIYQCGNYDNGLWVKMGDVLGYA